MSLKEEDRRILVELELEKAVDAMGSGTSVSRYYVWVTHYYFPILPNSCRLNKFQPVV